MASFNKKTYVITAKNVAYLKKKKKKNAIVFASTQLRITRLRKYPIDPKAYLGGCNRPIRRSVTKHYEWFPLMNKYLRGKIR